MLQITEWVENVDELKFAVKQLIKYDTMPIIQYDKQNGYMLSRLDKPEGWIEENE